MAQYIDKDALVAEINKRIIDAPINNMGHQRVWAYNDVKNIIETFEIREVDLEKEIDKMWNPRFNLGWDEYSALSMNHEGFAHVAKHFYELGFNARKED